MCSLLVYNFGKKTVYSVVVGSSEDLPFTNTKKVAYQFIEKNHNELFTLKPAFSLL